MQIVTDRCRLCDPRLILLPVGARNPRHETTFYAALGVKVGIATGQYGVGFESVFDIGSQHLDGDMSFGSIDIKFRATFGYSKYTGR